jgi:hypothetical protein
MDNLESFNKINTLDVPNHTHNGVDSPKISASNLIDTEASPFLSEASAVEKTVTSTNLAVGDLAFYIGAYSTALFLKMDFSAKSELRFGYNNDNQAYAVKFKAPCKMTFKKYTLVGLLKSGSPTDNVRVSLCSDSSGSPGSIIETVTLAGTSVSTVAADYDFTFNSEILADTSYWITLDRSGANDTSNYYSILLAAAPIDESSLENAYTGFVAKYKNAGTWTDIQHQAFEGKFYGDKLIIWGCYKCYWFKL